MSSGLLQVFLELGNLHGTTCESTGVACCDSVSHTRVQVFLYWYSPAVRIEPADDCLLREPTSITITLRVLLDHSEWIFGTYKLNVLTWLRLLLLCMIFYLCSYSDFLFFYFFYFFLSSLLNYRFPYCIQLYTWSTQQVIVAQHMCWFLKASNPPMFTPINYFNFIP